MYQFKNKIILFLIICFGVTNPLLAQINEDSELFRALKVKDSLLFDEAFNECKTEHLDNLISEDFEFYHDISGLTNSKESFIESMNFGLCGKTNPYKARRELIKGSLEVYPLYDNGKLYGAIQNGKHRFFETFEGSETAGSYAKFSSLWLIEDNRWKLKRVLSFDHQMPKLN